MPYIKLFIEKKKREKFNEKNRRVTILTNILKKKKKRNKRQNQKVFVKNLCLLSGRSKSFISYFGYTRHFFRNRANQGLIPGIIPASW